MAASAAQQARPEHKALKLLAETMEKATALQALINKELKSRTPCVWIVQAQLCDLAGALKHHIAMIEDLQDQQDRSRR